MSSKSILVAALAVAGTLAWQAVSAQASAPVTREQRKAETAAANKSGQLTPAGRGGAPQAKSTATSTKTREARKAETATAGKSGQLTPAGQGGAPQAKSTATSTQTREARKAETAVAAKSGQLTPAGEGPRTEEVAAPRRRARSSRR